MPRKVKSEKKEMMEKMKKSPKNKSPKMKKEKVVITPLKDMIKEHKELTAVLKKGDKEEMAEERKKQMKELAKYEKMAKK